jgi:hypothetical protein
MVNISWGDLVDVPGVVEAVLPPQFEYRTVLTQSTTRFFFGQWSLIIEM